jgi:leucyl aminopeptidase
LNGLYEFREFKTEKEKNPLEIDNFYIICDGPPEVTSLLEPSVKAGQIIAEAVHLARDLGNAPANILTPVKFADKIRRFSFVDFADPHIFNDECLEKMGMNAILAVGAGSENVPNLAVLEYCPPGGSSSKPKIVLVGKGLTFDSGGISIKPDQGMEEMKYDMAGAANVFAVVRAAAKLRVSIPMVAVMPLAENMPGSAAIKPGSVIKSYSGKTIEIINTDAEGRLLLADACSYAVKKFNPSTVITMATLTGACVIAAGNAAAGLMGNDPELVAQIKKSGELIGEKVQTFELFPEYRDQLKSDVADIKNIGGREAGAITAAMFVEEFLKLEENTKVPKWAHLDIAGTAYMQSQTPKKNYFSPGATGWGVRLLIEFLRRS